MRGKLLFHLLDPLAEFEREMICDQIIARMAAARERGRVVGHPRKLSENKKALALSSMEDKSYSAKDVRDTLGLSTTAL
ncbi:hypothetical protein E3V36_05715 [Candidatus Marinimicrobia bacterium MT.SAG.2]|nr:hypothetical protein E3V36_05715 [Candidatus Marinimicrobia bacterium MT.SAG.2]